MKRRTFLRNTSALAIPTVLGGLELKAMPSSLMEEIINNETDKILIIVDMNGGNDGLNTFIPLDSYDNLFKARQSVVIPENKILDLTDEIGVHPNLSGIKELYNQGNLSVIQGVGYPNQNRSHFRSSDIWNTGVASDQNKPTGWLGRYLDDQFPGYPQDYPTSDLPDPFAITMGKSISGTCQGFESNFSMAIINTNDIGGLATGIEVTPPDDCYGRELSFVVDTYKKSNVYAERVIAADEVGKSNANLYPDTQLGEQFHVVANLISGGIKTKIFVLKLGGFDTHSAQVVEGDTANGDHAVLMKTLSDAIYSFQQDIKALGLEERVIGMTFSEFGRKIISNAALGTDHGSAGPMMVFGQCVNAGIMGENANIASHVDPEEGVPMQYDFKWVYGSILMDWFDVEEDHVKALLSDDFQYLPIVQGCAPTNVEEVVDVQDTTAFPNPFDQSFSIAFSLKTRQQVTIDLSNAEGKLVKQVAGRHLLPGEHKVLIETHELPSGVYFARLLAGNGVKTIRVLKQ